MALILLILAHLLGDFYLQPDGLVKKKQGSFLFILLHGGIYTVPFAALLFAPGRVSFWLWLLAIFAAHVLVDGGKALAQRRRGSKPAENYKKGTTTSLALFFVDQALHLGVLILLAGAFAQAGTPGLRLIDGLRTLPFLAGFSEEKIGISLVLLLLVYKPAGIVNSYLLNYFPINLSAEEYKASPSATVGNIIGWLERTFVLIFCFYGQMGAIGLVLTAKSIARYKQLEKQDFAERYLFGTLFSVLEALGAAIVIMNLL